eukprot:TRINITY_DN1314_c0_g1_i4.p1 TRINITY_DN1314_c0_g1~~TRINITY_DN1314_c0_g1_i4.p1  ORF type:complete len:167 (+),score=0.02 TRINITY_DN1314_c0_g1_i4:378-878(+)
MAKCEDIVKAVMEGFTLPDMQTEADKRTEKQREIFKSFFKKPLVFNPLSEHIIDIRFMPSQVKDPLYEKFNRMEDISHDVFLLRAVTASGKTATMLNAIGRRKYLIYTECTLPKLADAADYRDAPFEEFVTGIRHFATTLAAQNYIGFRAGENEIPCLPRGCGSER